MKKALDIFSCLLLLLNCYNFKVFAQENIQAKVDSLEAFLKENPSSLFINYDIAELYKETDSAVALRNLRQGLTAAEEQNNSFGIAKGKFLLGNFYGDYDDPEKAELYFRQADTILSNLIKKDSSEEHLKLWVRANFNIGVVRSYRGVNEDIFYLNKISATAEKIGFYEILAKANTNIGITFYNAGQLPKAHEYFQRGAPQHKKSEDYESLITNRLLLASCLLQMDSLKAAKRELIGVKPVLDSLPKPDKLQLFHTIYGEYNIADGKYDMALENLEKAETYLKSNPIQLNKLPLYMTFVKVYRKKKEYEKGLKYAKNCLDIAIFYKNRVIEAELYKEVAFFQKNLGNHKMAFESLNNFIAISDTLNTSELEKEVNRLESQYQSEKKEREILQLKNDNNSKELELTKKQSQNYYLIMVSFGLLVLACFTYLGYRNFRKRDELKTVQINQLKYEQETKVYNAMLEGQENERKRLAIDLHDGLAGQLSATRIKLEKLAKKSESPKIEKDFKEAASFIDNSLNELRSIAMNLMPETLFKYGLKNAIEDYCSSIGSGLDDVKFILQFYDTERKLPKNTLLTIYRIIQELINNAVKHSKASEVLVQYLTEDDKINITVEDNGKGFTINSLDHGNGMGLSNLRTRVAYLNGEIDFDSSPGEGTNINITINI